LHLYLSTSSLLFFLPIPLPPISTLFPYTTLFRSWDPELRKFWITVPGPSGGSPAIDRVDPISMQVDKTYTLDCGSLTGAVECVGDRKSTRLNSSHVAISYAVFCLKKKKTKH